MAGNKLSCPIADCKYAMPQPTMLLNVAQRNNGSDQSVVLLFRDGVK